MLNDIREQCHEWHERLHRHPLLAPLGEGTVTLRGFKSVLRAFHRVYAELENIKWVLPCYEPPNAPVLAWLRTDIRCHEVDLGAAGTEELAFKALANPSEVFGYLYVKQGSTLGGQVISKNLERQLGLLPGVDNHFFYGYGPETGKNWKNFLVAFDQASSTLDKEETVQTAINVFRMIDLACSAELKNQKD